MRSLHPATGGADDPCRPQREDAPVTTNITAQLKQTFEDMRIAPGFALFSCFVNGKPTAAIVSVYHDEQNGDFSIFPLFVAVTDDMRITDHDGQEPRPL